MIAQLQDCTAHAHGFVRYGEMRLVWLRQAMLDSSQHGTIDRRGQAVCMRSACECYRHDGSTDRRCQCRSV